MRTIARLAARPGLGRSWLGLFVPVACLAGCRTTPWPDGHDPAPRTEDDRLALGRSVEGRVLEATVHGRGPRSVLLLGTIHGDEPGSHLLVADFRRWLVTNPRELDGIRLVIASPLNPDGLARNSRQNAHRVDLNRNFPARNFAAGAECGPQPLSEPEARFVQELLERFQPGLVISVHQPRRSVNYDGPALAIAEAMAARIGYRVEDSVGYPTPGSLGSWVGVDRGVPIITLELPRSPPPGRTFLDEGLPALRAALAMAPPARVPAPEWRLPAAP